MYDQPIFFRHLKTPIDDKGAHLAAQIAALNKVGEAEEVYTLLLPLERARQEIRQLI